MYEDEYGTPPHATFIAIGPDAHGLLLMHTHHGNGVEEAMSIVVPYQHHIVQAHYEITSQDNFDDCGRFLPCTALTAYWNFIPNVSSPFYTLQIRRLGTTNDEKNSHHVLPIRETTNYQLSKGQYVRV